ncbi:MAG: hypothetical protein GY937_20085 [bacterium]|nr:hypothetical protein [bacterium]
MSAGEILINLFIFMFGFFIGRVMPTKRPKTNHAMTIQWLENQEKKK